MQLEGENANPVTETASQAPAIAAPAPAAVTYPDHHHDVAQIDALEPRVVAILRDLLGHPTDDLVGIVTELFAPLFAPQVGDKFMVEIEAAVARELDARIENVKADILTSFGPMLDNLQADILAHLEPIITAIVGKAAAPGAAPTSAAPARSNGSLALEAGDPVKVWMDAEHKTFLEGEVVAIHDGAHAFDVKLPDGSLTKVGADGLEYDRS